MLLQEGGARASWSASSRRVEHEPISLPSAGHAPLYIYKYSGPGGAHGEAVKQGKRYNPVVVSDAPAIRTRAESSGARCPFSDPGAAGRRRTRAFRRSRPATPAALGVGPDAALL